LSAQTMCSLVASFSFTPSFFTDRMSFLSPNQQCQSTEGKQLLITVIFTWILFWATRTGGATWRMWRISRWYSN